MSLLRTRALLVPLSRSLHTARLSLVSGYGQNSMGGSPPNASEQSAKPDGAVLPNYSGPSIAEKRRGKNIRPLSGDDNWDEPTSDKMSMKGEGASDSQFKKDSAGDFGLATDASESQMYGRRATDLKDKSFSSTSKGLGNKGDSNRPYSTRAFWKAPRDQPLATEIAGAGKTGKKSGRVDADDVIGHSMADSNISGSADGGVRSSSMSSGSSPNLSGDLSDGLQSAKQSLSSMGSDLSQSAQELWQKTKKQARELKEGASDVIKDATTPVYARMDDGLYPTSDAKNARGGVQVPMHSPDAAAVSSGDAMGGDVNSVRKSLFDGPQDMPQGVGKRAVDEQGRPMETGARGS